MPNSLTRIFAAALAIVGGAGSARALTVIAPTFDQLVSAAEQVVRGVVTDVHCVQVDTPQGPAIRTLVTLHVERALKGTPETNVTLSFLGGNLGRRTMRVVGMPKFEVGERQILFFSNNGRAICPLVAAGHGRYHVRRNATTGRDHVSRDNGAPLTSTDAVVRPLEEPRQLSDAPVDALTLESFEAKITNAVHGNETVVQP